MSDDAPLLSKMDALLKKHRGDNEPAAAPLAPTSAPSAPPAWLPVLTQVIERGAIPNPASPAMTDTPASVDAAMPPPDPAPAAVPPLDVQSLLQTLLPRLGDDLKQQITHDVHAQIDQALATFSSQLEARLREILAAAPSPRD